MDRDKAILIIALLVSMVSVLVALVAITVGRGGKA